MILSLIRQQLLMQATSMADPEIPSLLYSKYCDWYSEIYFDYLVKMHDYLVKMKYRKT